MSVSFMNLVSEQFEHLAPWAIASASDVYQASAPARAKRSITLWFIVGSLSGLPQPSHKNTAIGTPQMRWREMHQSGRVAIMLEIRSSPQAGSQTTCLISSRARWRNVVGTPSGVTIGVSMPMNHCSVARTMMGLWQRQQWG